MRRARDFLTAADEATMIDAIADEGGGIMDGGVQDDIAAAENVFSKLAALEASYDPAVAELYADDGVVIERMVEAGVEKRVREIPVRRYRALLAQAMAASAKARLRSSHSQIQTRRIAPGWVLVRSLRDTSHARAPSQHEILVRREPSGDWRIVKETATIVL